MIVTLCCANATLQERWAAALDGLFTIYRANSLQDLGLLAGQNIPFDLLFLHRPLIDLSAVAYIRQRLPTCGLFIFADRPEEEDGLALLRLGVIGYANSYIGSERLQEAANAVAAGSVWINQPLMRRLIAESAGPAPGTTGAESGRLALLAVLSDREYQIAGLVADGLSNQGIADQLGITERTVKAHLGAIFAKTSIRGRLALALAINVARSSRDRGTKGQ